MNTINISNINSQQHKKTDKNNRSFVDKITDTLNKDISFSSAGFPDKKKLQLYNDLSMLLSSGIDIRNAFEILEDNFNRKADIALVKRIYQSIVDGNTISDAFKASGKFTVYEYYSLKIGEETGRLHTVLKDLSDYYSKKIEQKRKIMGAFMYPIIVVITAVLAIAFMLNFIVPMFEEIYQRFDKELPALTKFIIDLSHKSTPILLSALFIFITLFIVRIVVRKQLWYQKVKDNVLLRLPLFGDIIKKIQLSRFCLSMELLLSAKLPLVNALELLQNMISFYPLNNALKHIEQGILQGNSFYAGIRSYTFFDKRMSSLIKVGEEVNQLDKTFALLKEQYQEEVSYKTGLISSVLEPLMIVFIGVFVAIILISMYLPIFKISTSFGV